MRDPAFLFYSSDFLTGTMTLEDEQVGKYIRLLCLQHQKKRLTKKDMLKICKSYDEDIFSKFKQDDDGYFNERMEVEMIKRSKYSESRRKNREGKGKKEDNISLSYDSHMEDENENVIISKDWELIKDKLRNYKTNWFEKRAAEHNIEVEYVKRLMNTFIERMEDTEDTKRNITDYLSHFINWLPKNIKDESRTEKIKKQTDTYLKKLAEDEAKWKAEQVTK